MTIQDESLAGKLDKILDQLDALREAVRSIQRKVETIQQELERHDGRSKGAQPRVS